MKKVSVLKTVYYSIILSLTLVACSKFGSNSNPNPTPPPDSVIPEFIKGADVSWITQMESNGIKFYNSNGTATEGMALLKSLGMNAIRLRVWVNPSAGWNNTANVLAKAIRAKNLGMQILIDFHYSDYWANPGKQFKPQAWKHISFLQLKDSVYQYTKNVMKQLEAQNTLPDMVQVGNEINHGMMWPEGRIDHPDSFAQLIIACTNAVKEIAPKTIMLLHTALGGQNDESVFFLNNMISRGVQFDVIGESYYPKWHGTLEDLRNNLTNLINRYHKDIIVVEYSQLKTEINDITFNLPENKGKGTFIWEPLNT
jgi:arabinogalactan endo-1,4-beta-galactosidase